MNRIIIAATFWALISCNPQSEDGNKLDPLLESISQEPDGLVGFGVAIVNSDSVLYKKGFGYANIQDSLPYTTTTTQNVASISKTFIGVGLMKAQEEGLISLDDPVNQYLDFEVINPNFPDEEITIQHLATHTSSIRDNEFYGKKSYVLKDSSLVASELLGVSFQNSAVYNMEDYLRAVLTTNGTLYTKDSYLNRAPGEQFEYSNIGATLAALIIEKASSTPFDQYCKKYIFDALGMENSGWSFEQISLENHSRLFESSRHEIPLYSLITYPDGGLLTSINDLTLYLKELIRGYHGKGQLLNPESYQELFKTQLTNNHFIHSDNPDLNEGIFISIDENSMVGHSGRDPGVSTYMHFDSTKDIGYIVFTNTEMDEIAYDQYERIINTIRIKNQ